MTDSSPPPAEHPPFAYRVAPPAHPRAPYLGYIAQSATFLFIASLPLA